MKRIALLGCGRWGKLILRDLKSLGCKVYVWARSPLSVENAQEFGADQIFSSLEDLPNVDGAVIATISSTHFTVIKRLRVHQEGIPIFCEKPLCTNPDQLEFLQKHCRENLFEMHKWRYHTGILKLKEIYEKSEPYALGKLLGIKTTRLSGRVPHTDIDAVMILLSHDLSIVFEILGYLPTTQFGIADQTANQPRGIFTMLGPEPWVHIEVSERYASYSRSATLFFEHGTVTLGDSYDKNLLVFYTNLLHSTQHTEQIPFAQEMPLLDELSMFISHLSGGPPPKSTFEDSGLIMQRLFEIRSLAKI